MGTQPSATERQDSAEFPVSGGIGVFAPLVIRQPVRAGETEAVLDALSDWALAHEDGDVRTLLPVDGVTLATLFLDRGDFGRDTGDSLIWYVEVVDDSAPEWSDPDATIRDASPLYGTDLGDLLEREAVVYADDRTGHRLVTHAANPHRQQRHAEACGPSLVAPVAGDGLPIEVVLTTVPLRPGWISRVVERAVRVGNWAKQFDRISERLRDRTDTLEAEAMYTESLLLETVGDGCVLHYYMETEDMDRLYGAYGESDNLEVRFSDWVMRRVFVDPDQFLTPPLESDCEVLVHAVHPARP